MKVIDRYFLPIKTPTCHAATIAFFNNHPVFSWFGGSREGAGDSAIFLNNLFDNGETIVIGNEDMVPRWNPILVPIGQRLILFEKAGIFCDRWQTFVHDITNWEKNISRKEILSSKIVLPAGLNGPVKSCPLIVGDKLICGSSVETIYDWSSYIESYSISSNSLTFLNRSNPLTVAKSHYVRDNQKFPTMGIIQPTLWKTVNNGDLILHAFFRSSTGLNKVYYSQNNYYVNDKWSDPVATNLENPNSAVDVVFYNERLFIVHNPSSAARSPLVISEIEVDYSGNSVHVEVLDDLIVTEKVDKEIPCFSSELSYPYMIERDGNLHLVYTYGRIRLEYVTIKI